MLRGKRRQEATNQSLGPAPNTAEASLSGRVTTTGAKLLRRTEAARLLGVSKSTLRRMEGEQLTPVLGPGNVRLFHEEQVQSVIVTRHSRLGSQRSPGDVAADVFALFDSGTHPVDVVKQLRIEPELSEALHARWARMRGLLVLSKESRERIREMMCEGSEAPLATETEVLAFVDKWVMDLAPARCHQCRRDFAGFCAKCAKEWGLRTARRQIAEDRERRL